MELFQQIVGWVLAVAALVFVPYWTWRAARWWVTDRRTIYIRPLPPRRRRWRRR